MFDYLIHNARILDGSGAPARQGDVALSGRHIAAVGHLTDAEAAQVLDARGRYLTPGFLDIHRHADDALFRPGWGKAELAQGLTTVVNGNCGLSLAPVEGPHRQETLSYLAPIVGQLPAGRDVSTLRTTGARPPTPARLSTPGCWWGWGPFGPAWPGSGTDR